jgi:gamma-secretase subunit APH-1
LSRTIEPILNQIGHEDPKVNSFHHDFALGYGFACLASLLQYISPLSQSISPGIITCLSCPTMSIFFIGGIFYSPAIITSIFSLLHISWNIILFQALYKKRYYVILWVIGTHIGACYATLLVGSTMNNGCWISISVLLGILIVNGFLSFCTFRKIKTE